MRFDLEKITIAVALRMARAAVGWSQEELANKLGAAKTTIARAETGEGNLSAQQYFQIERLYSEEGVSLSILKTENVIVTVSERALEKAQQRLTDVNLRRSDRKKPVPPLASVYLAKENLSGKADQE
ncbi:MAG: helix-turn-helix transcriptional regulator [Burkholderiaceae bacterium]|nr:helix-turn-helix transcriptional regulator [Burkholderiaceae bacterium]